MPENTPYIEKPELFTTGCAVVLKYRSTHETDKTQSVIGHVIADEDGVLVIEEYSNFVRENPSRHILFDAETKDVYSQTANQTRRIGQATKLAMHAPPWDSPYDITAGGWTMQVKMTPKLSEVAEGIYEYVDPSGLTIPDDWSPEMNRDDPLPDEKVEKNPDTAYKPDYTTDI